MRDEAEEPAGGSQEMPEDTEQGNASEIEAIDRAWAGWHEAHLGVPAATGADMEPPAPGLSDQAAVGVSAALLSFRLRSGWHQQLDAAMSKFKRSSAGRRRGGPRPGQPR